MFHLKVLFFIFFVFELTFYIRLHIKEFKIANSIHISDFEFRISGFEILVSGFEFLVSDFGFCPDKLSGSDFVI